VPKKINHKIQEQIMTSFVQGNPSDGLGKTSNSNWQAGRGESPQLADEDDSHLGNRHAVGSSPCPADLANLTRIKDLQTMGK
jgi:hypothetical protein